MRRLRWIGASSGGTRPRVCRWPRPHWDDWVVLCPRQDLIALAMAAHVSREAPAWELLETVEMTTIIRRARADMESAVRRFEDVVRSDFTPDSVQAQAGGRFPLKCGTLRDRCGSAAVSPRTTNA